MLVGIKRGETDKYIFPKDPKLFLTSNSHVNYLNDSKFLHIYQLQLIKFFHLYIYD